MHRETQTPAKPPLFVAVLAMFCMFMLLLFVVFIFLMAFGYQFLPAPSYTVDSRYLSVLFGIINGAFWLVIVLDRKRDPKTTSEFKYALIVVFSVILGYFTGSLFVTNVFPMGAALAVGSDTEIVYVVDEPFFPGSKYCRGPIKLAYLPTLTDELCGFSNGFRETLSHGSEIVVEGRGTEMGLFVRSARLR